MIDTKYTRLIFILGIAGTALTIAVLHNLAYAFFWYWKYWWFDVLMHGLGGFFIGSIALWILAFEYSTYFQKSFPLFIAVGTGLCIGVLWEVFEYIIAISQSDSYILDTMSDIAMDIVGSLVAYIVFVRYVPYHQHGIAHDSSS